MSAWDSEQCPHFLLLRVDYKSSLTSVWCWANGVGSSSPGAHFRAQGCIPDPVLFLRPGHVSEKDCLRWNKGHCGGLERAESKSWKLCLCLLIIMNHNESFYLLICKEEKVSTEGRNLSSRSTEELPGWGLGTAYYTHKEAAGRMPKTPWTDWEVSFKCSISMK